MWTYQIQICLLLSVHTYIGTSWSATLLLVPTLLKVLRTTWSAANFEVMKLILGFVAQNTDINA